MNNFLEKLLSFRAIFSIVIAIAAIGIYIAVRAWTERYKKRRRDSGDRAAVFGVSASILEFLVLLFGLLVILQVNGIDITAIAAGLGIVSAIVGLALQDYLKDIIMGVHILADHFFTVGEGVEYDGHEGVIVDMTLKTTKIEDIDDHSVTTVCNRNISQIRRLSDRLNIDVPLSYGENVELVNETLTAAAEALKASEIISDCTYLGTQRFDNSAILYRLRLSCDPAQRGNVRREVYRTLQSALNEAGIEVPFPQLDVHCDMVGR